ncbi:MAG: ROK family protein [Thermotogae bacterium]|nr:ROK family protein [Thermotogota bacterium]
MNNYVLTLDVGGTEIKSAAVGADSIIVEETISIYESKSSSSKEIILDNFGQIINSTIGKFDQNTKCLGLCLAFPGPFDYENGICYIKGIGKYESLYNVNVKAEIRKIILSKYKNYFVDEFGIYFENDARLFALGEYISKYSEKYNRVVFITLGTGVGSAFIENGEILRNDKRIPPGGYIYNVKHGESTIESRFSAKGILRLAQEIELTDFESVKDLAQAARMGDLRAFQLFSKYGELLGLALKPFLERFKADALVIGGQISKSSDLFLDKLKFSLGDAPVDVLVSDESYIATFLGAYTYFMKRKGLI